MKETREKVLATTYDDTGKSRRTLTLNEDRVAHVQALHAAASVFRFASAIFIGAFKNAVPTPPSSLYDERPSIAYTSRLRACLKIESPKAI